MPEAEPAEAAPAVVAQIAPPARRGDPGRRRSCATARDPGGCCRAGRRAARRSSRQRRRGRSAYPAATVGRGTFVRR